MVPLVSARAGSLDRASPEEDSVHLTDMAAALVGVRRLEGHRVSASVVEEVEHLAKQELVAGERHERELLLDRDHARQDRAGGFERSCLGALHVELQLDAVAGRENSSANVARRACSTHPSRRPERGILGATRRVAAAVSSVGEMNSAASPGGARLHAKPGQPPLRIREESRGRSAARTNAQVVNSELGPPDGDLPGRLRHSG